MIHLVVTPLLFSHVSDAGNIWLPLCHHHATLQFSFDTVGVPVDIRTDLLMIKVLKRLSCTLLCEGNLSSDFRPVTNLIRTQVHTMALLNKEVGFSLRHRPNRETLINVSIL